MTRRWAIILTVVGLSLVSRAARADDPAAMLKELYKDFQTTLQTLDEDTTRFRKRIKDIRVELKELKRGQPIQERPDLDLPCDCRPTVSVGCDLGFWTGKMGYSKKAIEGLARREVASCVEIYQKFRKSLSTLPPTCEERVVGKQGVDSKFACGVVRRMAERETLQGQLLDYEHRLKEIPLLKEEARGQLIEIKKDLEWATRNQRANTKKTKALPNDVGGVETRKSGVAGGAR